ncbi:TMEM175 family protein, partial [Lactobacillus nasalidis]
MDKNRIMAFTDGIEAIAATIMVLELSVPEHLTLSALLSEWPTFFAYIVSFALIYLAWRSHHNAFQKADKITTPVYLVNGIWLFWSSLVPFATGLIGSNPASALAAGIYVAIIFLWTLTFQFLDLAILKANPAAEAD